MHWKEPETLLQKTREILMDAEQSLNSHHVSFSTWQLENLEYETLLWRHAVVFLQARLLP